jgi:hypothetical protein
VNCVSLRYEAAGKEYRASWLSSLALESKHKEKIADILYAYNKVKIMEDPVVKAAQQAFSVRLKHSSDVSANTKNAQEIAKI